MWRVGGRGEAHTGFWWGSLRERDHLGDPGVKGRIILRWTFKKWEGVIERIQLAQVKENLRALVNAATNIRVP
jgi:hypothetical protein